MICIRHAIYLIAESTNQVEFVFFPKKIRDSEFACWMDDAVENLPGLNGFFCFHISGIGII